MKKLIKYYSSADPKLGSFQLTNYGSFNYIIEKIISGNGFNPQPINKIAKHATKKEVTFTFVNGGNFNHKVGEVVNLQDKPDQEYVIVEVNANYLRCEYYDDYDISNNDTYTGNIVNSSLGFKTESSEIGKIIISDEYKIAKYIFHDKTSPSNAFNNTMSNKVIWMYTEAYNDPLITAPLVKTGVNYNELDEWYPNTGSNNAYRRGVLNLSWQNNQSYVIIGNGNFFYFISGLESQATKNTVYAFGTYKKYNESDKYNALISSKPIYNVNQPISDSTVLYTGTIYNRDMFDYKRTLLIQTPSGETNIPKNNVSLDTANYDICDILVCYQALSGYTSGPSAFTLAPATFFGNNGGSIKSGVSDFAFPNASNKMFLSEINIVTGSNINLRSDTLRGKMPFAYWYGHPYNTAPANRTIYNINDNGKIRNFYIHNNSNGPSIAFIEITPTGYDNYYLE